MTELFIVWVSFSLGTAIFSIWQLYLPIYTKLPKDHLLVRHNLVSLFIWMASVSVLAPFIVPALIVDEYRQAYIDGFVVGSDDA